jgi:predicted TIM-barrel fold metal-dependent hydrolase
VNQGSRDTPETSDAPILLVSADGHAGVPFDEYRSYLDPEFRSAVDVPALHEANRLYLEFLTGYLKPTEDEERVIDPNGLIAAGGRTGAWDFDRRLAEMDREGVVAEVVQPGIQDSIPPFFMAAGEPASPELRFAAARAHHRWLAERIADSGGRFIGVADPGPCTDLAATIAEMEWVAERGFRSVTLPLAVPDDNLPPLFDPYYAPLWDACAALGLVLSVHAGWHVPQGKLIEFCSQVLRLGRGFDRNQFFESTDSEAAQVRASSPLLLSLPPRRALWQMMMSGAFDRHPTLRIALTEVRADWVPAVLATLDDSFDRGELALRRRPSEYWAKHGGVTPSGLHQSEVELRHEIGLENLMFGIDFPHFEGTWPNTHDWIRASLASIPRTEARAILGENAVRFFGLDHSVLSALAAQIGPRPSDVLSPTATVSDELIEHFHKRAGFKRPADPVNIQEVQAALADDRQRVAAY